MSLDTQTLPGGENLRAEKETSLHRVTEYPVVKDSLAKAQQIVASNSYAQAAYTNAESLAQSIIGIVAPRLPLETVDGYANKTLDYVESKFPSVKSDTSEIVKNLRSPADQAQGVAKAYADGIQSRLSPVTEPLYARIAQGQEAIGKLQERLTSAVGSLPRDKASAQELLNSLLKEVESVSSYVSTNAKEFPAKTQSALDPILKGLSEGVTHIREELSKPDTPITQKASNVLSYTRSQVGPLLNQLSDVVRQKKAEVEAEAETEAPKVNGSS